MYCTIQINSDVTRPASRFLSEKSPMSRITCGLSETIGKVNKSHRKFPCLSLSTQAMSYLGSATKTRMMRPTYFGLCFLSPGLNLTNSCTFSRFPLLAEIYPPQLSGPVLDFRLTEMAVRKSVRKFVTMSRVTDNFVRTSELKSAVTVTGSVRIELNGAVILIWHSIFQTLNFGAIASACVRRPDHRESNAT